MQVYVDSREKARAIQKILKEFDKQGVKYFSNKLFVGDYQSLDNPRLIIDRKQNIQELVGNINTSKEHERFRKELLRAKEAGIQLIILIEHGNDIQSLEDVIFFDQPELIRTFWKTIDGKKVKKEVTQKAIRGTQVYKSMCTMRDRYGVEFEFCEKKDTGKRIIEILGGVINDQGANAGT